jgi:Tol biopolymer transport system component
MLAKLLPLTLLALLSLQTGPPTIGLWVFSLADGSARQVVIRGAPEDWDNVKNFAWSPDSKQIALTLGTTDCDYPGDAVSVFLTTVDLKSQVRLSPSDMTFEPAFAPDGSAVAFVDFSDSPAKLMHYDLAARKLRVIRIASQQNNYYSLHGWR